MLPSASHQMTKLSIASETRPLHIKTFQFVHGRHSPSLIAEALHPGFCFIPVGVFIRASRPGVDPHHEKAQVRTALDWFAVRLKPRLIGNHIPTPGVRRRSLGRETPLQPHSLHFGKINFHPFIHLDGLSGPLGRGEYTPGWRAPG